MTPPWHSVEKLADHHQYKDFCSGVDDAIDHWFINKASIENANGRTSTWVCIDNNNQVLAFFSLCAVVCDLTEASNSIKQSLNASTTGMAPATLLAKMGLNHEQQGKGHGRALVLEALRASVQAADRVACRLIVVDALVDELVPFYEYMNFTRLGQQRRLIMKMSRARKIITQADS